MVVIITGLIAGSLDLVAAVLLFISRSKQNPSLLFRYITSAALGPSAFSGGAQMVLLGVCFHYLIALCWTVLYLTLFSRVLACTALLTNAIIYGLFVWVIMNLVVLPLSKAAPRPFSASFALINIVILIIAIGLPCAYAAKHYPLLLPGF
ncbi:hypothetical protein F0L74_09515 [Chitinophaga agrisoli]|uniref:Uncharacterized protein n=1 Tax=Chitinophaga agrisoli TaxID=2607653 RepID=A0A5B2VUK4_9BACT|nr:hypothetical protein [Chitinophaga agrisoli]KAA2242755.1 hypothetical protein F0L74_09515 [Chitinophaga agrisoli]